MVRNPPPPKPARPTAEAKARRAHQRMAWAGRGAQAAPRLQVPSLPEVARALHGLRPSSAAGRGLPREPRPYRPGGGAPAPMVAPPWSEALQRELALRWRPLFEVLPQLPMATAGLSPDDSGSFSSGRRPEPPTLSRHSRRLHVPPACPTWKRALLGATALLVQFVLAPALWLVAMVTGMAFWGLQRLRRPAPTVSGDAEIDDLLDGQDPGAADLPAARVVPTAKARPPARPR